LSSHTGIFNGDDEGLGIVDILILGAGLMEVVLELETAVLSALECTCAGVDDDIELLKVDVIDEE
jgi:hypothetical protein